MKLTDDQFAELEVIRDGLRELAEAIASRETPRMGPRSDEQAAGVHKDPPSVQDAVERAADAPAKLADAQRVQLRETILAVMPEMVDLDNNGQWWWECGCNDDGHLNDDGRMGSLTGAWEHVVTDHLAPLIEGWLVEPPAGTPRNPPRAANTPEPDPVGTPEPAEPSGGEQETVADAIAYTIAVGKSLDAPTPRPMTVGQLTAEHIGKRVQVGGLEFRLFEIQHINDGSARLDDYRAGEWWHVADTPCEVLDD